MSFPTAQIDVTVFISVSGIVASGLLGVFVSQWMTWRATRLNAKRDVLTRLTGNRFALNHPQFRRETNGEPYVALNEICVVYAKDSDVIEVLKRFMDEIGDSSRQNDNMLTLIKRMAKAAAVPIDGGGILNDEFFLKPFAPPASMR